MSKRFYDMVMHDDDRWSIAPKETDAGGYPVDTWVYREFKLVPNPLSVELEIVEQGNVVDYCPFLETLTVSRRMANVLSTLCPDDFQRIPAILDGPGEWEVLNLLHRIDCIDHVKSKIQYWPSKPRWKNDLEHRPEKAGKPSGVIRLIIDPNKVGDHHLFVCKDWEVANIISETGKRLLEENGITGIEYWPVTM